MQYRHAVNQLGQSLDGLSAVFFEAAMLLGLDDDDSFLGNALICQCHEALLDHGRQGRCYQIKTQVRSRRYFVDVLPACTLGANRRNFNFIQRDGQMSTHGFRGRMIGSVSSGTQQNFASWELP